MREIKLKPCPFCGGKAKFLESRGDFREPDSAIVVCTKCFARVNTNNDKRAATLVWNTRAGEQSD